MCYDWLSLSRWNYPTIPRWGIQKKVSVALRHQPRSHHFPVSLCLFWLEDELTTEEVNKDCLSWTTLKSSKTGSYSKLGLLKSDCVVWFCVRKEQQRASKADSPSLSPDVYARYKNIAPTLQGGCWGNIASPPTAGEATSLEVAADLSS